ncbi:MAG: LemA family protein [Paludibacteraceae bacterium]|nr:LemA family protein [Bacteroidales bacterium]MBO5013544.1 LemA family protein [Paludibacteraceae bacterium]MBP3575379.1 LemA family protein [Paludibacteraceae bacterium]
MSKKTIIWIAVLGVLAIAIIWGVGRYNAIITAEENVNTAWSQVENQYQRRADLIPNLVETVKGYAAHESETLEGVIAARAKATQVVVDPTNASAEQIAAFQAAQGELSQALGRLMAISENYPDLKANQNFGALQSQLEGTENRITVARNNFNEVARQFNTMIRRFPTNIIANMMSMEKRAYFEATEGAEVAPKVEF